MKPERIALVSVAAGLAVGGVALLSPGVVPVAARDVLEPILWGTTVAFAATALVWVTLAYVVGGSCDPPAPEYGGDEIQVRILTVDAASVVQRTVDSLPPELADVHVVAEEPVDVAGATVHVVPDEFDCEAVRKGRAIEWVRRTFDHDREFVLYLDEDSVVDEFHGLPDADVVQLRELPRRTDSPLAFLADVYRTGVQVEQRAFARLSIPLFAWGGGFAVRREVEDAVTWDRETIVEDTAFVYAAAREFDLSFELGGAVCRNEAPPSLHDVVQQRRRWTAGNLRAASMLPVRYRVLARLRNASWAVSPVVTLVALPLGVVGYSVVYGGLFALTSVGLALLTVFWYLRGVAHYVGQRRALALAAPLAPLVTVVHSVGTVAGVMSPPEEFRVTEKVGGP
jgi:hypothetical protein